MTTTNENATPTDKAAVALAEKDEEQGRVPAAQEDAADEPSGTAADPADGNEAAADEDGHETDHVHKADGPAGDNSSSAVALGAGAVVSAALGVVSLTGGWVSTVAAARSSLVGQLGTSQQAGVAKQVQAVYGDSWKVTALIAGIFALAALVSGVLVLVRPAFGAPRQAPAVWIRSLAWGGVALGVIGLVLAVLKYTDVLLGLPSVPSS